MSSDNPLNIAYWNNIAAIMYPLKGNNMKTKEQLKAFAKEVRENYDVAKHGTYSILTIAKDLSRKEMLLLSKYLGIHRGSTTSKKELHSRINYRLYQYYRQSVGPVIPLSTIAW